MTNRSRCSESTVRPDPKVSFAALARGWVGTPGEVFRRPPRDTVRWISRNLSTGLGPGRRHLPLVPEAPFAGVMAQPHVAFQEMPCRV